MTLFSLIYNLLCTYSYFIFAFICSSLIVTYSIDGLKYSDNKYIRILQKSLCLILLLILIIFILSYFYENIIYCSDGSEIINDNLKKDKQISVGVSTNINVDVEGAKVLSEGISSASKQIGLGASVGAVATAAAKLLKTAAISPSQKIGLVLAAAAGGGAIHVGASAANKALALSISTDLKQNNKTEDVIDSPNSEFSINSPNEKDILDSLINNDNPVDILLESIYILNVVNIILLFYLTITLLSKFLIENNSLLFKFIDNNFSPQSSEKIKLRIMKVLNFSSKSSLMNLIIILILLYIFNFGSLYLLTILINNFAAFCKIYLSK